MVQVCSGDRCVHITGGFMVQVAHTLINTASVLISKKANVHRIFFAIQQLLSSNNI